jgi:hypothetical protein
VSIAAPQAEAAKKPKVPIDPSSLVSTFLGDLTSVINQAESQADTLVVQMKADIENALDNGNLKQVLKLDKKYEKLIRKSLGSYEKYAAKGLKRALGALKKITADPTITSQIESAMSAAFGDLDQLGASLRDDLSGLIDEAVGELTAE